VRQPSCRLSMRDDLGCDEVPIRVICVSERLADRGKMATFSRIIPVKSFVLVLSTMLLLSCAGFAQGPSSIGKEFPSNSDAKTSFGALKGLAGTWVGQVTTDPPNPEINGPIQVTMRVASRGNALIHEMAPSGMPEPTMIYVEDDRLTLVHYCEAGNRPRLVARKSADPNSVDFQFVDISGSKEPAFVEHLDLTIIDADHHTEDWTFMLPDNQKLHAHFNLKRVKGSIPPAAQP